MFLFAQLFVLAVAISTAYGATYKVADSPRDYYLNSQRQLLRDIELVNLQIAEVDARILDRVTVIAYEKEPLLIEIKAFNRIYFHVRAVGPSSKHCYQEYDPNFISYESANYQLEPCYKIASGNGTTFTSTAKSAAVSASDYATTTLSQSIAECDTLYSSSNKNSHQKCYTDSVTLANQNVHKQLDAAKESLTKALFDSAAAYRSAKICTFEVKRNVLETIARTNRSIQTCLFQSEGSMSNY